MKTGFVLSCVIILQLHVAGALSQPSADRISSPFCIGTEVVFDTTAISAVYCHPDEASSNVDSMWTVNAAYKLAVQYCRINRVEMDRDGWAERVSAIASLSNDERAAEAAVVTSREIVRLSTVLFEKGIPHISSFLPSSAPPLKVTVYLISDIKPAAFAYPGGILINVNSPRFNCDPSVIMNIIVHEIYHGGYANTIAYRTDYDLQNETLDFIMDFLLNEGMATYVSYAARNIFPNDFVPDYALMESMEAVKVNFDKVDLLLRQAETLKLDSLKRLAWQTGVIERAFYIAGGYMAGLIDERMGREELVRAMCAGPRSFLNAYNSVADKDMLIRIPELPDEISLCQKLRLALVKEDTTEYNLLANELMLQEEPAGEEVEHTLNRYGYMFLRSHGGIDEALELFRLNVKLFPESSRVWDSLGEGTMVAGNNDLAISHYEKSLALNPSNENARRILEKLKNRD